MATTATNKELETRRTVRPVGNIWEEEGKVMLRLEMPGVTKDNIELRIENDQLFVRGHRDMHDEDQSYVIRERVRGDFAQTYTLDDTIDRERIDARMERGILTVTLHLKEAVKPRKIEVKAR
ncbi:MAG: Hsp20/alpha crystallin family protein [Spirochaetaceae bacterium]|nr:MAG: Hsp20/alpha crystallin family protein [Spirochaetaceae bacterium]